MICNGVALDSRYVVPYNPYLSMNVEVCNSIHSCKCFYKYVYKSPETASVTMELATNEHTKKDTVDEIKRSLNSRFITASEVMWRMFSFNVHGRVPSIHCLAVHEENLQSITIHEDRVEDAMTDVKDTTLLGWFKLNSSDPNAHKFKCHEIPEHYVWSKWTQRKRGRFIGCVYTTSPSQCERHYLHLLCHHVLGATSFADLCASPVGEVSTTCKAAAMKLGLLDTDEEWD